MFPKFLLRISDLKEDAGILKFLSRISYLPGWNIFSELLIDDATNGHDKCFAGHLRCVVHPKIILKVLTTMGRKGKTVNVNHTGSECLICKVRR